MVPSWAWWLLAVIWVHGWAIMLAERSYGGCDPETNTLKRTGKRDFPRLSLCLSGLVGLWTLLLALAYQSGWWLVMTGFVVYQMWNYRHEPRRVREEAEERRYVG